MHVASNNPPKLSPTADCSRQHRMKGGVLLSEGKYQWVLPQADERLEAYLAESLGISRLAAGILAARGWQLAEEARSFLDAHPDELHDPFLMKDMANAAARIKSAIQGGERIRVYGDYDADGVTSTALMVRLLTMLGAEFDTYIPHRSLEGYGLNKRAIELAAEAGVRLIVTVDNGISAVHQIAYAREIGIEVVVTDHHEPPEELPAAVALVNPKQKDCNYPYKGLCGAGVVFKLAHALTGSPVLAFADLAAIGTIADLMPLTGENRIIVRHGLALMQRSPNYGIAALAEVCGCKPAELSSGRIGFGLAPRLNAGGRLERADSAVKLLGAASAEEARQLALQLDGLNTERQRLVEQTLAEAEALLQQQCAAVGLRNVIVLAKAGWNAGIAGLVASKLVERYYRPTIILAVDETTGLCKGSARSIEGFDLYAALTQLNGLLVQYGGHQAAAGMTLRTELVEQLSLELHQLADEWLSADDWQPKKRVDRVSNIAEATLDAVEELTCLEPFGNGNPTPRMALLGLTVAESRLLGKEGKHLRLLVEQDGRTLEAVGFSYGEDVERLKVGSVVDLLGELSVNDWRGSRKVQFVLQDWRTSDVRMAAGVAAGSPAGIRSGSAADSLSVARREAAASVEEQMRPRGPSERLPSRQQFAEVYRLMKTRVEWLDTPNGLLQEIAFQVNLPLSAVRMIQDVFIELGFIREVGVRRIIVAQPPRKELEQSARYRRATGLRNELL